MPSERKIVAYRPDKDEERILQELKEKSGLTMSRVIGQAIRRWGKEEGIPITLSADKAEKAGAAA